MAASKAVLHDFWMCLYRNFSPQMQLEPSFPCSLSLLWFIGFARYLDFSFKRTRFCKLIALRILYFWVCINREAVSRRQPKCLECYWVWSVLTFIGSFRIEWNIFGFIHEMFANNVWLRIVTLPHWFVFFEGSFIARTEDIRIIMTLHYFGRLKFRRFR